MKELEKRLAALEAAKPKSAATGVRWTSEEMRAAFDFIRDGTPPSIPVDPELIAIVRHAEDTI